jgi:hypothetical protein
VYQVRELAWIPGGGKTNIEVPRLDVSVSPSLTSKYKRALLHFSLLEVVHVDVNAICNK